MSDEGGQDSDSTFLRDTRPSPSTTKWSIRLTVSKNQELSIRNLETRAERAEKSIETLGSRAKRLEEN